MSDRHRVEYLIDISGMRNKFVQNKFDYRSRNLLRQNHAERDEQKRQGYLTEVAKYDVEKLVYIDESGIDKFICREHGWNVRGEKVRSEVSGRRYARESFIAGLIGNKVIAPLCYTGTCDSELFNFWLEN